MSRRVLAALLGCGLLAGSCADSNSLTQDDPVEIFVPLDLVGPLAASLAEFESETGIDVRVTGTDSFVADLLDQVDAADPPDIAFIPQPGLVAMLRRSGDLVDLPDEVIAALDDTLDPRLRPLVAVDGDAVAVPVRLSVKSLVWYRPDVIAGLGVETPVELVELVELVGDLRSRGVTPWCFGLDSGGSTGWVATDWSEDLLLRTAGPDLYDRWVAADLTFASAEVTEAFDLFDDLIRRPGSVSGGLANALRTPVRGGINDLFTDPTECVLHRQASFAAQWIPPGFSIGPDRDLDFFVLPGTDDTAAPLLLGATVAVAFSDDPFVAMVLNQLSRPDVSDAWVDAGGYITPHQTTTNNSPLDGRLRALLESATTVRIDASDSMRPDIGSQMLWSEITRWVSGSVSYERFAEAIDEARADPDR